MKKSAFRVIPSMVSLFWGLFDLRHAPHDMRGTSMLRRVNSRDAWNVLLSICVLLVRRCAQSRASNGMKQTGEKMKIAELGHTTSMKNHICRLSFTLLALCSFSAATAGDDPLAMEFRRLAVERMVFNNNINLAGLDPSSTVDLPLMYLPEWNRDFADQKLCKYKVADGVIAISNDSNTGCGSTLLVGGVNPYAVYDLDIASTAGKGAVGLEFSRADFSQRLKVMLNFGDQASSTLVATCWEGEKSTFEKKFDQKNSAQPCTLRVQMMGTGLAIYLVSNNNCNLVGTVEAKELPDFRRKTVFSAFKFRIGATLEPGSKAQISSAKSYLSCGSGQADIRIVTQKDGSPLWKDDRLWFLFSARGWLLPHSTQGVLSLNPRVFDLRFEGLIVFDYSDGLLRADVGTHLFYDEQAREWQGWSCNFSTTADGRQRASTGINTVRSKESPLKGFSIMKARPLTSLEGKSEDPCGIWDQSAGKWRLLLSSFQNGIKASLYESDTWDGAYKKISGPVAKDSTGTLIQQVGDTRYVFSGSADQKIYIYSYPELNLLGDLKMDYPPWDKRNSGRVWPNIFKAPEGHPYPYLALMMDRVNFPALGGWTYGALYLYGACVSEKSPAMKP